MGEVVGAGLLSHVPTMMLPDHIRRGLNNGLDSSLVTGLRRLRHEVFETVDYDTVVVLDSHWHTTIEFVVAAHERRAGLYTSDELPRGLCRLPYDFAGDPELAHAIAARADKHGTWITAVDDDYLPIHYSTLNLWTFLGVEGKRWMSIGVCQTGEDEDHLRLGRALGDAIAATDRRVLLVASGSLSHTFWPLRQMRDHEAADPHHIFSAEALAADMDRVQWMGRGDHAQVLSTMDDFHQFSPEARFGHYLMMIGALGGQDCTAPGEPYSRYENACGTGQVHLWFDRPAGGWTAAPKNVA
jgi:3,4-dihydroxyphenylacetate 2,3-dioxygenase